MVETPTTSASLLLRLEDVNDTTAWPDFIKLFAPIIYYRACCITRNQPDAWDLTQEVFTKLLKRLVSPNFEYNKGKGRFRDYLNKTIKNCWCNHLRKKERELTNGVSFLEPTDSTFEDIEEQEYRAAIVSGAYEIVQSEFQAKTWEAYWRTERLEESVEQVAISLNVTEDAVYLAKSRVHKRLEEVLREFLDE